MNSETVKGSQVLVPNVPNKIYFQVKTYDEDYSNAISMPLEFTKADIVMLSDDGYFIPVLDNIYHGHNGRSSFTFTPIYVEGLKIDYYLRIYRDFPDQIVKKHIKQFKLFNVDPAAQAIMTLSKADNATAQNYGVYSFQDDEFMNVKFDVNGNFIPSNQELLLQITNKE
jgi:hypothetical protein